MKRTQIQFTEEQLTWLRQQAASEGVSVSALVRRSVHELMGRETRAARAEQWERALSAAGAYCGDGADVARDHDDYLVDAYRDE